MQMHTSQYSAKAGWSEPLPGALDGPQTLVLALGAPQYADDARPWADLRAALPQAMLIGCSTSGEIAGRALRDGSVSVVAVRFEHTRLRRAQTAVADPGDSAAAGARLAAQLPAQGLRAVFLLSDGLCVNGTALVAGLVAGLPAGVTVTGGLAGDGSAFRSTWVLAEDQDGGAVHPQPHRACAVGLYGERLHVSSGCDGGWLDFGPQRRITKSAGSVLHELDGKPALDLYREYLGDLAAGLPGTGLLFPLSIHRPGGSGKPLVRTILAIDEAAHTMTFAGDVPEGFEARLMRATDDGLIDSAATAVAQATAGLPPGSRPLVISVSCVGRRLMLGERTEEEVETIAEGAPEGAVHLGFYSYGEIAPGAEGGACGLHNQTMTVTVYAET
jgi:hypothetical protein